MNHKEEALIDKLWKGVVKVLSSRARLRRQSTSAFELSFSSRTCVLERTRMKTMYNNTIATIMYLLLMHIKSIALHDCIMMQTACMP
jgi:hypothetical protein